MQHAGGSAHRAVLRTGCAPIPAVPLWRACTRFVCQPSSACRCAATVPQLTADMATLQPTLRPGMPPCAGSHASASMSHGL